MSLPDSLTTTSVAARFSPCLSALVLGLLAMSCAKGSPGGPGEDDASLSGDAGDAAAPSDSQVSPDASSVDSGTPPTPCDADPDCDDTLACNGVERCEAGYCTDGEPVVCSDGVACTVDSCVDPSGSCDYTPDSNLCAPGEQCHATLGCRPVGMCETDPDCDDGAACNGAERCAPSDPGANPSTGCVAGTSVNCDDTIPCTQDRCVDPAGTCEHVPTECPPGTTRSCITSCGSAGNQLCGDDCLWAACQPPTETCNGVDDNCDGTPDDGFECAQGSVVACSTTCGSAGTRTCSSSCTLGACVPPAETCNGLDDDCNGTCDDGFACCSGSSEACATTCGTTGSRSCSSSCAWGACLPPAETCNGLDDNCNGVCDDGFACCAGSTGTCTTTCGSSGTHSCSSNCSWSACTPPPETCNGADDDCDGSCDNGFTCCAGSTGSCTTTCGTTGSRSCSSSCSWGSCTPPAETCNGVDDNCNGSCDEGFACCAGSASTCVTTCGTTGSRTCSSSCSWGSCTPPAEICNGADDNCNGLCDDGFACCAGSLGSCTTTCGTTGSRSCSSSCTWGSCVPPAEVCNGLDDNCNGTCDEGFACCAGSTGTCVTSCGSTGLRTCSSACGWGSCTPPTEVCNGVDDDCDGSCDNGFACCAGSTESCTVGTCSGTRTCSGSCGWGTCTLGGAPANDTCSGTLPTISASGSFSFSTCAAANDYTASCGSSAASPDVVYRLSLSARSDVVLEITSASHDTVLHLRSGASCPGTELLCDDDGGTGVLSRISTTLDAGTYWVVVDGYGTSNQGAGTLQATITPQVPANDTCATATPISLSTGRTTVSGTTAGATSSAEGCTSAPDLWYRFTLSRTEVVYAHLHGSAYDTYLGLRRSSCAGTLTCVDDSCYITTSQIIAVLPAGTHYLVVDGFSSYSGDFSLTIEHLPVGNGGTATALSSGTSTWSGTTSGTGVVSDCVTGTAPENLYYFTRCPADGAGYFTGSTCLSGTTYDTAVYLWSGATGGSLSCNDDDFSCSYGSTRSTISSVSVAAGAGLFGYYVDGWSSSSGSYQTSVTVP